MSIFQKRANKFFRSFLCGPEKVGHFIIIVSKKLRFTHLNDINEKSKKNTVMYNCIFCRVIHAYFTFIFILFFRVDYNDLSITM
jgi:hypothetical protein